MNEFHKNFPFRGAPSKTSISPTPLDDQSSISPPRRTPRAEISPQAPPGSALPLPKTILTIKRRPKAPKAIRPFMQMD
ncbi:uncharacterized protein MONOS_1238 [Monocercomonoides exilis]|uniref:uncharacterized protein n=1 Tax=Monocercomonoides exilis TaxID=2049356 RepID=UPI0035596015|nr:hypothetical protein MONOS_1238 [Monocercomonoides exilis]|eukprot:MONOS_1238.1-p1 / transcript=MONOS_1238.1 / gene=MONOS_1238 / organism=Monocercomonoides_exilis_PA203 / gene_product=unspecified product / transcript_product=unspecified product / location=Mono_scaffold00021:78028-78335(+) / protein_length=78 / sequence_SO=supercontig / SO=protein_coding / is_pseudo=false